MAFSSEITLVASRTDTATVAATSGTTITGMDQFRRGSFALVATGGTGSGSVTIACSIQAYIFGYWSDIARFADVTANAERILWDVGGTVNTSTTIEEASQSLAITAGTKRAGPWGTQLRARYSVTVTGTYSITWTVVGVVQS